MSKKSKRKSYTVGALVMAGMIVLSIPLGAKNSLENLRREAESDYYYDDTGYAVYQGIDAREEAASNLITIAQRYVDANPDLDPYIDELDYRVKYSKNMYSYQCGEKEVEANDLMGQAAEALYEQLEKIQLSEKDEKYPAQLIAEMRSQQDKIERSSYNGDAAEFNARLDKFPMNFINRLVGVQPMGVFGEESSVALVTEEEPEAEQATLYE